jgi:glycosyltransferase involved in cell wall biosynthesis
MKILVVSNMYPTPATPGAGTFVRAQVEGLRKLADLDIELIHVERELLGRGAYGQLKKTLAERISDFDPDVVHVMYGGVMADVVTRAVRDRPVVVTFYGTDLFGLPKAAPALERLSAWYGVLASRRAARRAARVVVQSQVLADRLPKSLPASRVRIVPDGVDFDVFVPLDRDACRQEVGWTEGRRHVLFPSTPSRPEKRFELAHAAVDLLPNHDDSVELHVLEGVQPERVVTWLNASDVVLLTSRYEGSPNVVKEALACDVPVVSVDVGDVRERLAGIEGCYVANADADDLAAKLELVLSRAGRIDARSRSSEISIQSAVTAVRDIYAEAGA